MISSLSHNRPSPAELFSRIDTDSDGKLTAADLKTDFESHIQKASDSTTGADAPPAPDYAQMVSDGDTDGDGSLSEVEFSTAMQVRHHAPPPPPSAAEDEESTDSTTIEQAISSLDTDGDGKLSAAELQAAYLARAKEDDSTDSANPTGASATTAAPDFSSLIALVDSDGDGLLNTDEITSLLTDSRRAQQPPPPPPMSPQNAFWDRGDETAATSVVGEA